METILKVLFGLLVILFILAIGAGVSALMAYIVMLLWNFVVLSMHRSDLQLNFWVAWAVWFLICIVGGVFRSRSSSRN